MVVFFVSHLVLFEEKLAWVSFVADCFTVTILSGIEMLEKRGKKEKMLGVSLWPIYISWPVYGQCHQPIGFRDYLVQESHFTGGYWGLEEWCSLSKARHLSRRWLRPPGSSDGKPRAQLKTSWLWNTLGSWHFSLLRPVRGPSALWGPQGPPSHPILQLCLFSLF